MKDQIRSLKLNLKQISSKIREHKRLRKKNHPHHNLFIGTYALSCLKEEFRHKHVAYCLARGRSLEQVDSGNNLNMDRVEWLLKAMQPDSKEKLYVVVNSTLSTSQQAVQSAHAVAEFMKNNPHSVWRNGYLVLLKEAPGRDGDMFMTGYGGGEWARFREPDMGNKVTAYAVFGPCAERYMKNKQLL